MNVEECLRVIRGKAALVRYLASCATLNPEVPDPATLAGLGEVCEDIERLARAVTSALGVSALAIEIKRRHQGSP